MNRPLPLAGLLLFAAAAASARSDKEPAKIVEDIVGQPAPAAPAAVSAGAARRARDFVLSEKLYALESGCSASGGLKTLSPKNWKVGAVFHQEVITLDSKPSWIANARSESEWDGSWPHHYKGVLREKRSRGVNRRFEFTDGDSCRAFVKEISPKLAADVTPASGEALKPREKPAERRLVLSEKLSSLSDVCEPSGGLKYASPKTWRVGAEYVLQAVTIDSSPAKIASARPEGAWPESWPHDYHGVVKDTHEQTPPRHLAFETEEECKSFIKDMTEKAGVAKK